VDVKLAETQTSNVNVLGASGGSNLLPQALPIQRKTDDSSYELSRGKAQFVYLSACLFVCLGPPTFSGSSIPTGKRLRGSNNKALDHSGSRSA
jgi:hypothetical protein